MITIFAEKPDMGTKFAAALDGIRLHDGTKVSFENLGKYEKQIIAQRSKDGYFLIHYQGQPAYVTWGYGHICGLKQAKDYDEKYKQWGNIPLPFIPRNYELKVADSALKQFQIIKKLFSKSNLLICATDDDREGDLIFDNIYQYLNCKIPFKRVLFNKQSQEEFIKAFSPANLVNSADRKPIIDAGRARRDGDFIVGANLTAAMTLKNPGLNNVLSVGRVQTAVLNMITTREDEILHFKPKDYLVIKGIFTTKNNESYVGTHEGKRFFKEQDANAVFNKLKTQNQAIVKSVESKKITKEKPHLYSLPALQMEANKFFGFSLEKTLELAQSLYDKGFTTYPRTDSSFLPNDMSPEMQQVIDMLFRDKYYSRFKVSTRINPNDKHYFDSAKVSSHYAIVPTKKPVHNLTNDESKLYFLIATSVICMVYPKAIINKTTVVTECEGELFKSTGNTIVEAGFYRVIGHPKENLLPFLREGDKVAATFEKETKQTEPPKRYTDATLLNAMINCGKTLEDEDLKKVMAAGPDGKPLGLGRPSSQASIVKTLEDRGYIIKKQKTIHPTDTGMTLIKIFPVEELKSAIMTAQWEKRLDEIANKKDSYASFMKDLENSVRVWTQTVVDTKSAGALAQTKSGTDFITEYKCPFCKSSVVKFKWGYACEHHKDKTCKFAIANVIAGKTVPDKQLQKLLKDGKTDYISGFKSQSGKIFGAKLEVDLNAMVVNFNFNTVSDKLMCPICKEPLRPTPFGYGCSGYSKTGCRFSIGTIKGKKLTDKQIQSLLAGKEVLVSGMKSQNNKPFNAKIKMELSGPSAGKISFIFQ